MEFCKLLPASKDNIWGGKRLFAWHKPSVGDVIAETWELSCHPDGPCFIASGKDQGKRLMDVVTPQDLGKNAARFPFFPVLIKLIDADGDLSVQVHPSDDYALSHEGQYGKTEMWHIIAAEQGAGIYVGWKRDVTPEEVKAKLRGGTILELCHFVQVHPGETYFIPSGTVHAIARGVTLMEIQQNSNLTYRLYDYGRRGKDGKPRELHVEKALKVLNYHKYEPISFPDGILGECDYFRVSKRDAKADPLVQASEDSFASFTFLSGHGLVNGLDYEPGSTFFLPAGQSARIEGDGVYVLTTVPSSR